MLAQEPGVQRADAAATAGQRAARHRGHRHPAAAARLPRGGDRVAHPRPDASGAARADVRAHRRAGHQPGRALQARALVQPGLGDDAGPRPPRARRARGRQRLPRQGAVERQHRRARHGAHRARLRRSRQRQRRRQPELPQPRGSLRHRHAWATTCPSCSAPGAAASSPGVSTSRWPAAPRPTAAPTRCSTARCCAPARRCR